MSEVESLDKALRGKPVFNSPYEGAYQRAIDETVAESNRRTQALKKPPTRTRICIALLKMIEPPNVPRKLPREILKDRGWTPQEIDAGRGLRACLCIALKRLVRSIWELMWVKTNGGS